MTPIPKRALLIGAGAVVLMATALFFTQDLWKPLPKTTIYRDRDFSFEYPRVNSTEEYDSGAVAVGVRGDEGFAPLVEVIHYQSDPDSPLPPTFDAYVRKQALVLCGSDGPVEDLTCTDAVSTPYTSAQGLEGQELSMTLVRTNLESGTTTSETFSPLYIFNMTRPADSAEDTFRYGALFVYPAFSSVVSGNTSSGLLAQIIDSLLVPDEISTTTSR